ncbi:MAG: nucleoside hydrolase [Bacilli bacterium]|nr:nucleoside hydrolase [Bacilli bacterium]
MLEEKRKVILDTDIGDDIDDSFALLLLLESKKFDVLGVTTVFRNSKKRAMMAKEIIDSLGYDVKVYPGRDEPLRVKVDKLISPEIKEREKLDEEGKYLIPQWDESMRNHKIEDKDAVDFIIEMVHKYPGEVTLIPIGPMTNIASAITKDPSIIPLIKEIRFMGAGLDLSFVEWNVFCDPDAAKIVLSSGVKKIEAITFNVTSKTEMSNELIESLKNSNAKPIKLIYKAMLKWFDHYKFSVPVMHDPLCVVSLLKEDVVECKLLKMDVDLSQDGYTFINDKCNNIINVAISVKTDDFYSIFKEILNV